MAIWSCASRSILKSVATFSAVSGIESDAVLCAFISLLMKRQPMVVSYTALLRLKALGLGHDEGRAAHAPPARDHQAGFAGFDGARCRAHGIQAGAAQAVDGGAGTSTGQARQQAAMWATLRLSRQPGWRSHRARRSRRPSPPGLRSIRALSGHGAQVVGAHVERAPP